MRSDKRYENNYIIRLNYGPSNNSDGKQINIKLKLANK